MFWHLDQADCQNIIIIVDNFPVADVGGYLQPYQYHLYTNSCHPAIYDFLPFHSLWADWIKDDGVDTHWSNVKILVKM